MSSPDDDDNADGKAIFEYIYCTFVLLNFIIIILFYFFHEFIKP
jgi:hypothetical protein